MNKKGEIGMGVILSLFLFLFLIGVVITFLIIENKHNILRILVCNP